MIGSGSLCLALEEGKEYKVWLLILGGVRGPVGKKEYLSGRREEHMQKKKGGGTSGKKKATPRSFVRREG